MKKQEMSNKQLSQRDVIVKSLSDAGWAGRKTNQLFDDDYWVHAEAVFAYQKDNQELIFQFYAEKDKISLSIQEEEGRLDFVFRKFENTLNKLLVKIVSSQDTLSLSSFKEDMKSIIDLGVEVYFLNNDDCLIRVSI